ncbi:MAG: nucleoside deaminase [Lachnospiraceae bacterium]|nr:nucleoside deaminase [Lachnospiraceae bacterium]
MTADEKYMKEAMKQAKKALKAGDVPIGCVIVFEDRIIARGYNKRNAKKTTLAHAELLAMAKASKVIGDWRLEDCTMYVTLEPCQMCAGAIVQARIPKVVIGTMNPKAGCAGSVLNLLKIEQFNHQVEVVYDVLKEECSAMLSDFFKSLREMKKQEKLMKAKSQAERS